MCREPLKVLIFLELIVLFVHNPGLFAQSSQQIKKRKALLNSTTPEQWLVKPARKSKKSKYSDQHADRPAPQSSKSNTTWYTFWNNRRSKHRSRKTECPDITIRKASSADDAPAPSCSGKANIIRSTYSVDFDVLELEDIHLDIPAFKQFKNNMTDFTADGEHEFQKIIEKIGVFLGTNYEGKGITLRITGSASQIPTSFDPDLPNNNINPDGSSIIGKTSIANNAKLAKARADELAKKIKAVFPSLEIITPTLDEIEIGKTQWTSEHQKQLSYYYKKKDKQGMERVYAPFQKDQWVKVESQGRSSKTIQPESLKMYMISTTPNLRVWANGQEFQVRSVFIVSKKTFEEVGDNHLFATVEDRDEFLEKLGLKVFYIQKNGVMRWYMLKGNEEIDAFNIENYNEKVFKLFELGIVDSMDEQILENKIIAEFRPNQ